MPRARLSAGRVLGWVGLVRALLAHRLSSPTAAAAAVSDLPIVSNWLTFDAADRVNGFSQPLLHMFNKDGAFVRSQLGEARWAALASGRSVCLLLGDGLGDASMAVFTPMSFQCNKAADARDHYERERIRRGEEAQAISTA